MAGTGRPYRMQLFEDAVTTGDYNADVKSPNPIATVWGRLIPLSGTEGVNERQTHPTATHKFETAYSTEFIPIRYFKRGDIGLLDTVGADWSNR